MRKFLNAVILIPLGLIFIAFAVANRHAVTVSFDPFNSRDPSLGFTLPLFVVIIAVAVLGVVAGGAATWFRQRHWRRAARQHEADARAARSRDWILGHSASRRRVLMALAGETSRARRCRRTRGQAQGMMWTLRPL